MSYYDGYEGYDGEICEMGDEEASVRRKISPRRDPAREVGDRDPWREEAEDLLGIAGRTIDASERGEIERKIGTLLARSEEVDSLMSMMERHGDDYWDRRR